MGVRKAIVKAVRLSIAGYLVSLTLPIFIKEHKDQLTTRAFFKEQIVFYFASFVVFLCWELNSHLLQVFLTERHLFAPTKGSAAAETNPSDHLLAALEESTSRSLIRYLAYLDLCMVSESNVDTWRRAAFFEETGETYRKVIGVCLKPLEQLTLELSEGLGSLPEKSFQLSNQLRSSNEPPRLYEPFYDHQICAWCARIVTSLTIRSHKEDRFGVAQLSGCNAATTSTLLACLLAVEAVMGKKTNLQSSNGQFLMGPTDIKWAALGQRRKDTTNGMASIKKDGPHYAKAYYMADILRTSIYQIVSSFHHEMVTSSKGGLLEKDWIIAGKPLYGSRELLVHKLNMFLEFQAN
ncbi:putative F-box protein SKIP19-like protein [Tanacetum coccineum]